VWWNKETQEIVWKRLQCGHRRTVWIALSTTTSVGAAGSNFVVARASFGCILARGIRRRSGMPHICLVHVNELAFDFSFRKKIHYQQVHIAVFEHMREFLIEKSELLIV
jgi:hypothetical protein